MRSLLVIFGLIFSLAACADQTPAESAYQAGKHYVVLDQPVRTADPSKIEVAEVFAYTCGHCFTFEPLLQAWKKQQRDDVVVVQVPAIWNPQMEVYARGFFTARALGILDEVHMPVFNYVHTERKRLASAPQWADFLSGYGVSREDVLKTFNSFGVTSQVRQADSRVRGYQITGTPEMVVDGRYRISSQFTGSHSEMLKVVDYLVAKTRAERN
jgi:protein dithiol oxidoreductase (disulfide-forming)